MVIGLIGLTWGDEGKGKVIDYLTGSQAYGKISLVIRYQGGANAGHRRVMHNPAGKLQIVDCHLLPSGVGREGVMNLIGSGVLGDPLQIQKEIGILREQGFDLTPEHLGIDGAMHVVLQYHIEEDRKKGLRLGTTGRGIGPTAVDKYNRTGIRFEEFLDPDSFVKALEYNKEHTGRDFDTGNMVSFYTEVQDFLRPFLVNENDVRQRVDGEHLYEGAQGCLLDIDSGTFPDVTSSSPTKLPVMVDRHIGVLKAYYTRVGTGPFPTKLEGGEAETLRGSRDDLGGEYGVTTGRPRDVGWHDFVLTQHAIESSGVTEIAVTKLDCLAKMKQLYVCTGYRLGDKFSVIPPKDRFVWKDIEPVLEEVPAFYGTDFSRVENIGDLPYNAMAYLDMIEKRSGKPVRIISFGPDARQTIIRE